MSYQSAAHTHTLQADHPRSEPSWPKPSEKLGQIRPNCPYAPLLKSRVILLQAEKWEEHTSNITIQSEEAIAKLSEEKGEALEETDPLSQRLMHCTTADALILAPYNNMSAYLEAFWGYIT